MLLITSPEGRKIVNDYALTKGWARLNDNEYETPTGDILKHVPFHAGYLQKYSIRGGRIYIVQMQGYLEIDFMEACLARDIQPILIALTTDFFD